MEDSKTKRTGRLLFKVPPDFFASNKAFSLFLFRLFQTVLFELFVQRVPVHPETVSSFRLNLSAVLHYLSQKFFLQREDHSIVQVSCFLARFGQLIENELLNQ